MADERQGELVLRETRRSLADEESGSEAVRCVGREMQARLEAC
jgi:hypothetical protein